MQGNKVQRPLSGGRAAGQTAPGAGVWRGLTAGSEQGAKSRRNPRGPGQLTAKSRRSRGQRRQESSAQAPRGKLNLSRQRPGPGSRPPPPLSAGPGPPHPPAPRGSGSGSAPLRTSRPLPRSRPAAPSASGRGQPGGREPAAPPGGRRGWSGAERSRAGPGPPGALSEPPALPGGGAAPRSGCGGPGLGLKDLRVTDKAAFRAFQPSVMTGRERRAFPVSSQVSLG